LTLQGKQNHYNVKFLKGYGFSVSVKDSKIILKNNYDLFERILRTPIIEKIAPINVMIKITSTVLAIEEKYTSQ